MNFACELMDLCRGTQEVEAVLGEESHGVCDPLSRLRLAVQNNEKKVGVVTYFICGLLTDYLSEK